jgi:UDP-glucose 4-epimerase
MAGGTELETTRSLGRALAGAKVLVTGGVGLVGSSLARRLVQLGCDVLLVDSLGDNFGGNLHNIEDIRDRVRLNISDIRDRHGLRVLVHDRDFIFNLAGQTSHQDSMEAPFQDLEINCTAQLSLVETCRRVNANVRIVFASTRQVYGRPEYLPVDEKHPVRPVDVNGVNKTAGESYHLLYHSAYGLRTTVLRMTNTYGPGMRIKDARQIFLGIWLRRLIEDRPFEVWGGDQLRDFAYVDDAVDAFIAAALCPATEGKVLNLGGSPPISLRDLAQMLIALNGGGTYTLRDFPMDRKRIDIGDYYTDDRAFRDLTGWVPRTDVETGLRRALDYYRQNLALYV